MKQTIVMRIQLSSLRKIRRIFYARKDETASSYFERLSEHMEQQKWDYGIFLRGRKSKSQRKYFIVMGKDGLNLWGLENDRQKRI